MIEVTSEEQLVSLIHSKKRHLFFLKHSTACHLCAIKFPIFEAFATVHPEITCAYIIIQSHRALSNKLAEISGVKHESPQIIHYIDGEVKWDISHNAITKNSLEEQIQEQA